ncbi:hypothetical protein [Streptomyces zagrosensis]|uniref:Uncharacterized protein n=1 Tax=Streptomyces zagrosensis TaxID=1042984 RepID=A0A7W9QHV5_9ACTN|nr:hypothetical protein [Streptomyces zagrosensis]MBB5940264.1 hypothetical protein [Streptomyces zagrosensis]
MNGLFGQIIDSVSVASLITTDLPRLAGENTENARTLAQSGHEAPSIIVYCSSMPIIADEVHRLNSVNSQRWGAIDVKFFDGREKDAFVFAMESNAQHGLPLPLPERAAATERIVKPHPERFDRAIAAATSLMAKIVAAICQRSATEEVPQLPRRIGWDDKVRPADRVERRRYASTLLVEKPHALLRDVRQRLSVTMCPSLSLRSKAELNAAQKIRAAVGGGAGCDWGLDENRQCKLSCSMRDPQLARGEQGFMGPSEPGQEGLGQKECNSIVYRGIWQ